MVFLKDLFEKVDFEKKSADYKKHEKLPSMQVVKWTSPDQMFIRPNKKILVFRVTRPYLNLLKPRIFFRFCGKIYNFMLFERHFAIAFQNA